MKFVIESERLVLRQFELDDDVMMFHLNSDAEVLTYTGDVPFKSNIEAREFLKNYSDYKLNGYGRWVVVLKETNESIGWCGLKLHSEGYVDIGFRFFKKYWNIGYATESAKACLSYGFNELGLTEIIGRASLSNIGSVKVLEKLNLNFWKKDECNGIPNAGYFRINKKDFERNIQL